ncbi:hypothetical protein KR49_08920 [Synechococcus sp. KORDI-49]|uniref:hypothetical protein n=1 Tax=Synechococcus sp. KORDI-49 TaxID=585423 RepID=UPI0004E09DFE|nr:hypothetical protein [Synechococcus sp. KORDI-49]AII46564.1 hypothetical protein KR49_08920 [Synechococcus sp. KORDI-49]
MSLPDQLLLSDLLNHTVRCDRGLDHGPGVMVWMHPPVHRLLGWVSRPSALRLSRDVWRLDQCCGFTDQQVFVRGDPSVSDQATLDRLPTLIDADLINRHGDRLGTLVDLSFSTATGAIREYLVARSDPRLPGSSRWRLTPDRILDQRPGVVSTGLTTLEDLPLHRASLRQDLLQRTQRWRDQLRQMGDRAGDRLEGWLDEPPWQDEGSPASAPSRSRLDDADPLEDWEDELWNQPQPSRRKDRDEDPWV